MIVKDQKGNVERHLRDVDRLAQLIESAISVASYAIQVRTESSRKIHNAFQLDQFESMFDVTVEINNKVLKDFWMKKIGRDVSKYIRISAYLYFVITFSEIESSH